MGAPAQPAVAIRVETNVKKDYLQLMGVSKRYGGIAALNDVSFQAASGTIHAILGENGAGKSTLMKTLAGVVRPDTGVVRLDGKDLSMAGPSQALEQGIVCIFQELSLVPYLSVAANICLANPPRNRFGLIDERRQRDAAREVLAQIGCDRQIDLRERCIDLPLSQRQIVEIAKAVIRRPRVLILDEATSALTAEDVDKVMRLLRNLRNDGTCILFISHRMHEVDALADTCSVFRNGEHVSTFPSGSKPHEEIVRLMIGRPIAQVYPEKPEPPVKSVKPYLEVHGLRSGTQIKGVDLDVRPGEIVGLGGLDGQGQRELMLALAGLIRDVRGDIRVGEQRAAPSGPRGGKNQAYRMALIPEDRKTEGLMLGQSVYDNLGISTLDRISRWGVVDHDAERSLVGSLVKTLQIKAPDTSVAVSTLSGGNQQKVVLAKWLATEPRLLLLMDPTRGVDVGTKQEIYRLFRDLAAKGLAILFYSTDCDELIGLCDRVLVMYDGQVRASLAGAMLNEEQILMNAMNLGRSEAPANESRVHATTRECAA